MVIEVAKLYAEHIPRLCSSFATRNYNLFVNYKSRAGIKNIPTRTISQLDFYRGNDDEGRR